MKGNLKGGSQHHDDDDRTIATTAPPRAPLHPRWRPIRVCHNANGHLHTTFPRERNRRSRTSRRAFLPCSTMPTRAP